MKSCCVLLGVAALLAVASARPQTIGNVHAGGTSFQRPGFSALNLNAHVQNFNRPPPGGFSSNSGVGFSSGVLLNSPTGNTADLQSFSHSNQFSTGPLGK